MSGYNHTGQVYFVACGGYVKIGYCTTPISQRLASLPSSGRLIRPADMDPKAPLRVLRLIPNCIIRDERRLHVLFAAYHAIGEWYYLTPAFQHHLARLQYNPDRDLLAAFRRARRELKKAKTSRFVHEVAA